MDIKEINTSVSTKNPIIESNSKDLTLLNKLDNNMVNKQLDIERQKKEEEECGKFCLCCCCCYFIFQGILANN